MHDLPFMSFPLCKYGQLHWSDAFGTRTLTAADSAMVRQGRLALVFAPNPLNALSNTSQSWTKLSGAESEVVGVKA